VTERQKTALKGRLTRKSVVFNNEKCKEREGEKIGVGVGQDLGLQLGEKAERENKKGVSTNETRGEGHTHDRPGGGGKRLTDVLNRVVAESKVQIPQCKRMGEEENERKGAKRTGKSHKRYTKKEIGPWKGKKNYRLSSRNCVNAHLIVDRRHDMYATNLAGKKRKKRRKSKAPWRTEGARKLSKPGVEKGRR